MFDFFSRTKRQARTEFIGDLKEFREENGAYLAFIEKLTAAMTVPGESHGKIKVTKRDDGVTKVTIKDSATNDQIAFIYRNRDLYIVGMVVGTTFYVASDVYDEFKNKQVPAAWKSVINAPNTVRLSKPFTYAQLSLGKKIYIGELGESLNQLLKVTDTGKRITAITHLAPFVVAFSEAIRFPVIAKEIQKEFRKSPTPGVLDLSVNLVETMSLGHPDQRTKAHRFEIYDMLFFWGDLSDRAAAAYGTPPENKPPLQMTGGWKLGLHKSQLELLLGVAKSTSFDKFAAAQPSRGKRDLTSLLDNLIHHNPPLLEKQINYVDFEGNVEQGPSSPPLAMASITHSPDVIGALQLLTVGALYLYGKKMNVPLGNAEHYHDPKEAFVMAVDLTDRLGCFLNTAGVKLEIGFEEEMELQRQVAKALIRGESVEPVLTKFFEQHYADMGADTEPMGTLREQLVKALAAESGLVQGRNFPGDVCFQ